MAHCPRELQQHAGLCVRADQELALLQLSTISGKTLTVISKSLALLHAAAAADNLLQSYLVLLDLMLLIRLSGNGLQPGHF